MSIQLLFSLFLLGMGGYFTIKSKFATLRFLPRAIRSVLSCDRSEKGEITIFSSLCTNLGAAIGTGNIVGVTAALAAGGPGALLWMNVAALFGLVLKFLENALAVRYQVTDGEGRRQGGPFAYISHAAKGKTLPAAVFAVSCMVSGVLGMGTIPQSNSIFLAVRSLCPGVRPCTVAFWIAVPAGVVILGGSQRIASFSQKIIPPATVLYIVLCVGVVLSRFWLLPGVVREILRSAVLPDAVKGGALGQVISVGVRRGLFSNEAGLGTSAIAAGCTQKGTAKEHGFSGIAAVFIDTILLCTLTGLTLLVGGYGSAVRDNIGQIWSSCLGLPAQISDFLLTAFLTVFAFTSIVGWNFYAERSYIFLFGEGIGRYVYQLLCLCGVFLGPFLSQRLAWAAADVLNLCLAGPNLFAMLRLRRECIQMIKETDS